MNLRTFYSMCIFSLILSFYLTYVSAHGASVKKDKKRDPNQNVKSASGAKRVTWQVQNEKDNTICTILESALTIIVNYNNTNNQIGTFKIYPPQNATVTGDCRSDDTVVETSLEASWDGYYLNITFSTDNKNYGIKNIAFAYTTSSFPNTADPNEVHNTSTTNKDNLFSVKLGYSFACGSEAEYSTTDGTKIIAEDVRAQAFKSTSSDKPDENVVFCDKDFSNQAVPIAVGCTLIVLCLVVGIVYAIGRMRANKKEKLIEEKDLQNTVIIPSQEKSGSMAQNGTATQYGNGATNPSH